MIFSKNVFSIEFVEHAFYAIIEENLSITNEEIEPENILFSRTTEEDEQFNFNQIQWNRPTKRFFPV